MLSNLQKEGEDRIEVGNYIFIFKDLTDLDYVMDCFKDEESINPTISITILSKNDKKQIAVYQRNFEKELNEPYYQNFVKKIINDSEYRKKYLVSGGFEENINCNNENNINPQTVFQIKQMNNKNIDKCKFKDYVRLKSGMDGFSKRDLSELACLVDIEILHQIEKEFNNELDIASCIRWNLRGLNLNHSIRKVKTDAEVRANASGGRKW